MTVIFFISGHGFGHAARQVEIINAVHRLAPDATLVIRSAVAPALLARTVRAPYLLRPGACDTGIVQTDSITHDDPATVRAALDFYEHFDARVAAEMDLAAGLGPDVIVGDIPPLAFAVAAGLGVPSVAIANFTWDWIYETHPGLTSAAPQLPGRLRAAYRRATLALQLPLSGSFDAFTRVEQLPLVTRHPTQRRDDTRRFFGLSADRPVALLSFGGYGLPALDLERVDAQDWVLATTDRVAAAGSERASSRVVHIAERRFSDDVFRYEDLVEASDVVVTKPGYGIIAECIATRTPILYTSRGSFREYDVLVREMPRFLRAGFISRPELLGGRWQQALNELLAQPEPIERLSLDGAEVAARRVLEVADQDAGAVAESGL